MRKAPKSKLNHFPMKLIVHSIKEKIMPVQRKRKCYRVIGKKQI